MSANRAGTIRRVGPRRLGRRDRGLRDPRRRRLRGPVCAGPARPTAPRRRGRGPPAALEPRPLERRRAPSAHTLGRVFGVFDVLAVIAVIVAGLGIVNTLTMNVLERVREIGVLRAAGMTRRQVWRMVVVEAGGSGSSAASSGPAGPGRRGVHAGARRRRVARRLPIDPPWLVMGLALALRRRDRHARGVLPGPAREPHGNRPSGAARVDSPATEDARARGRGPRRGEHGHDCDARG